MSHMNISLKYNLFPHVLHSAAVGPSASDFLSPVNEIILFQGSTGSSQVVWFSHSFSNERCQTAQRSVTALNEHPLLYTAVIGP